MTALLLSNLYAFYSLFSPSCSELDVWGLISLVGLQVGVPDVAFKPFTPQGEGWVASSLSIVSHQTEDGVYRECVSLPFRPGLMWVFSCSPDW